MHWEDEGDYGNGYEGFEVTYSQLLFSEIENKLYDELKVAQHFKLYPQTLKQFWNMFIVKT